MDVALLFFLPLIGGFLFVETSYFTRFKAARQETQRLYYKAAACGVLLSVIGFVVHRLLLREATSYAAFVAFLSTNVIGPLFERPVSTVAPALSPQLVSVRVDLAFACAWGFAIGASTPLSNGVVYAVDRAWFHLVARRLGRPSLISAINQHATTDQIEILLTEALRHSSQVQVTLSTQKVYVGWVTKSVDPRGQEQFLRLQPSLSGYRSTDTVELHFTTFYDAVLDRHDSDVRLRSYQIVIPIDKIVSASGFDLEAYAEFQAARTPAAPEPAEPVRHETVLSGDLRIRLERSGRVSASPDAHLR